MRFQVRSISQDMADEVRRSRVSPGYGHPAHLEVAKGTGPCRCCLQQFEPGRDQRLLFTFRPDAPGALTAPGPVFIHAERCEAWQGEGFPPGLRGLPLAFEARAAGSRVIALSADVRQAPEAQIDAMFAAGAEWLHLRNAEAGCFIATIARA
jgi:hypothetical protein